MQKRKLYKKRPNCNVTAVQIDLNFESLQYEKWGNIQTCEPGDWLVDNDGDIYTVKKQYFRDNYYQISPGVYEKNGEIWAEVAEEDGTIDTLEGATNYKAGDYLVYDRDEKGDGYAISKNKFEKMYEEVDQEYELTIQQKRYIEERLKVNIKDSSRKAKYNKIQFFIWQVLAIISASLVPVFSGFEPDDGDICERLLAFFGSTSADGDFYKRLVAILGATSAVIASFLSLFKFQENWIRHSNVYESLQSHYSQFKVGIGIYKDKKNSFELLVENCERIFDAERGRWSEKNSSGTELDKSD